MEHGKCFQIPVKQSPTPFLTPFKHLLTLTRNTPPMTKFNIEKKRNDTYQKFQPTLNTLEQKLRQQQATVLSADKGPGLIIIQNATVLQLYR